MEDSLPRRHMLELEHYVWRHEELPVELRKKLVCMVDDIVNFVSNAIFVKHDYKISDEDADSEYAIYSCAVDAKVKQIVSDMFRIWKSINKNETNL